MATKQTGPKKKSSKVVNVELEKMTEQKPNNPPVTRVSPEIIASIKNTSQIEEEELAARQKTELEDTEKKLKNRLLFYGGVACAIGIGYLLHRYYTGPSPPIELVPELVNGVANIAP